MYTNNENKCMKIYWYTFFGFLCLQHSNKDANIDVTEL